MSIELKKKMAEKMRVEAAAFDMEIQIEEYLQKIELIKKNIETQRARVSSLENDIKNMKESANV